MKEDPEKKSKEEPVKIFFLTVLGLHGCACFSLVAAVVGGEAAPL